MTELSSNNISLSSTKISEAKILYLKSLWYKKSLGLVTVLAGL